MAKPRIGDVIEITTRKGRAYAQYSHQNPREGSLLRILPGFHDLRPQNFDALVAKRELFHVFFPLGGAVKRGIVTVVANEPVPEEAKKFPLFRCQGMIDRTGKVLDWWLWDGQKEWQIGQLTLDQRKLPIWGSWNDTLLIERLEEGWTPSTDPQTLRSS